VIDIALGAVAGHAGGHRVGLQRLDGGGGEDAFGEQGALARQVCFELAQARFGLPHLQAIVGAVQLCEGLPATNTSAFVDQDALDAASHLEGQLGGGHTAHYAGKAQRLGLRLGRLQGLDQGHAWWLGRRLGLRGTTAEQRQRTDDDRQPGIGHWESWR